jgi:DNA-binding LacI/PurR family transcriptional regulator
MSNPPSKRVTIRDVAKVAGVSVTTVSHALNGKGRIEQETIQRVREAAQRLGYQASHAARNLRGGRTGRIAVINSQSSPHQVSLVDLEHFVRLLSGASELAVERGYTPVLTLPNLSQKSGAPVDGVIIVDPVKDEPLLSALKLLGTAVVTTGRDPHRREDADCWVDNDLYSATGELLAHLLSQGAQRIALIASSSMYSYSDDAVRAYQDWCHAQQVPVQMAEVDGPLSENGAYVQALRLLQGDHPPQAIHCVTDRYAFGVLLAAQSLGLRVPEDLLISAGTDGDAAASNNPSVTALQLHPEQIGREAVALLIDRIEGLPVAPRVVPYQLQIRSSTLRHG